MQARAQGGLLDRAAQLVAAHRSHQHVVGGQQPRQLRIRGAAPVVVGAHRDQHQRAPPLRLGGREQRVDEPAPLRFVAAGGERLLELVDRDHEPTPPALRDRLFERGRRMLARAQQRHRPALTARQHTGRQRRQQTRA